MGQKMRWRKVKEYKQFQVEREKAVVALPSLRLWKREPTEKAKRNWIRDWQQRHPPPEE